MQGERPDELPFPLAAAHGRSFFYLARNAIYHLVKNLHLGERETVLVPDYHHGVEVAAIRAAGASIAFYPIDRRLEPDLDALAKLCKSGPRVLFVIHFLGWPQPMREIAAICKERGIMMVEDCALSLLSAQGGKPLGSLGDYAVFSLYKTLPLPNGGLLVENERAPRQIPAPDLARCGWLSLSSRCMELTLDWVRGRHGALGSGLASLKRGVGSALTGLGIRRWPIGSMEFDPRQQNLAMSALCHRLFKRFDYQEIQRRRRRNFLQLSERLEGRATPLRTDLAEGVCPLFFPLLVRDKHAAAVALWRRGIGAVEFWNQGDPEASLPGSSDAQFLREHVLELPIHQDLGAEQIDAIANAVSQLDLRIEGRQSCRRTDIGPVSTAPLLQPR
jgi:dTDP-4-amino-4,6-dideoxygalactose transaminase